MIPFVIVVRNGVVDEVTPCKNGDEEKVLLDKCAECLSNWGEYTPEQIQEVLDDGYEKFGNGSVCLT